MFNKKEPNKEPNEHPEPSRKLIYWGRYYINRTIRLSTGLIDNYSGYLYLSMFSNNGVFENYAYDELNRLVLMQPLDSLIKLYEIAKCEENYEFIKLAEEILNKETTHSSWLINI